MQFPRRHDDGTIDRAFTRHLPESVPASGVDAPWRSETVVLLARELYESRDFSAMPILADALEEAGCDSADVLEHCRQPGEHCRGCWYSIVPSEGSET